MQVELAQRRERLVARSDELRRQLSDHCRAFQGPVQAAGLVYGLAAGLRRSPLLITGLGILLMKTPWRSVARLPKLAWRGWQILQFIRKFAK